MTRTLVLPPRHSLDSIAVRGAAIEKGWEVERLGAWRVPEWLRARSELVFYGEPLFAAVVASQLGVELLEPPLDWLARVPVRFLRREVRALALCEARSLPGPLFVKPADDKCFASRVYSSGAELPRPDVLPDSTPVLTSEPVSWELELRCFVRERSVLTLSPYLRRGALAQVEDGSWPASEEELAQARAFAAEVLAAGDLTLPPGVVLDVGTIEGRGWAVVEANAAWGSGIYGCDPALALEAVARACVAPSALTPDDRRWIVARTRGEA